MPMPLAEQLLEWCPPSEDDAPSAAAAAPQPKHLRQAVRSVLLARFGAAGEHFWESELIGTPAGAWEAWLTQAESIASLSDFQK